MASTPPGDAPSPAPTGPPRTPIGAALFIWFAGVIAVALVLSAVETILPHALLIRQDASGPVSVYTYQLWWIGLIALIGLAAVVGGCMDLRRDRRGAFAIIGIGIALLGLLVPGHVLARASVTTDHFEFRRGVRRNATLIRYADVAEIKRKSTRTTLFGFTTIDHRLTLIMRVGPDVLVSAAEGSPFGAALPEVIRKAQANGVVVAGR